MASVPFWNFKTKDSSIVGQGKVGLILKLNSSIAKFSIMFEKM